MQPTYLFASVLTAATFVIVPASAQQMLTGDVKLACEATLCLASGTRPQECMPSLRRYFSISYRRFVDTVRGRINFLKLCPSANQSPQMAALVEAIANGAGQCNAATLNVTTLVMQTGGGDSVTFISNQLPDYCSAYLGNQYTNLGGSTPKYVGSPLRGGYWVNASDFDAALAAYNARIAAEDLALSNSLGRN